MQLVDSFIVNWILKQLPNSVSDFYYFLIELTYFDICWLWNVFRFIYSTTVCIVLTGYIILLMLLFTSIIIMNMNITLKFI